MTGPAARRLGERLHLQHGPIDLIIGADGARARAFAAARARFETVLEELMDEIHLLRAPIDTATATPAGEIAQRMVEAGRACANGGFVTPMAGVAGAVAETVLEAMTDACVLSRAYVNNGGDIALQLTQGTAFKMAMAGHNNRPLGLIHIAYDDPIRGIATSGRHGRSLSRGVADSVTVLAASATQADVAATLIANAVDVENDPAIRRQPACDLDEGSDLGRRLVVTGCGPLGVRALATALDHGQTRAQEFIAGGQITGACLFLQGQSRVTGNSPVTLSQGTPEYA
ncbi:UPF0280 family protein [Sulfitobacter sp. M57]|uniref:UPF0280 family protein n=1 Tax=unclassified Sulfitobacter TaxID=196795 RepID=UPI0023E1FDC1|nr:MULTISPECIES: UPF0280 family protein [unclassified Sulfitobacter]MDF3413756.1 UPF0280 family protein [Sulfitobacter sp. KE5]MDF3420963.1 UPF0280 family protein [Sulfitobacter sp. KE43]MDF3432302.1 UPF0280 family protein [Sulfitobacter sp. KE42]MDF3457941.1 UPF0280 family protein [Sulfitobacter sp. S74]MDF3461842.1 UPF0280 family protein [Sulfitobacter sp. Ks18]